MFSDNPILGVKETTIDNKGRIILPKFTFAEKADELEITRNLKTGILEIYSLNPIQRRAAHKYIHAKNLVDNYSPQDVYILQKDGSKIPVTTKLLDYYASILPYDITSVDKTEEEQD